jgi:hypothetical protein
VTDLDKIAAAMKDMERAQQESRPWTPEMEEHAETVRRFERAVATRALFRPRQPETDRLQIAIQRAVNAGVPLR